MKYFYIFLSLHIVLSTLIASEASFNFDKTMRIDYFHTGTSDEEVISLDCIYEEGTWSGSRHSLIDTLDLGNYRAKITDASSNEVLFSRGYCSLFGEWQTTDEALEGTYRSFHETVRCPYPNQPVNLIVEKRNRQNIFTEIFDVKIMPDSRFVNREQKSFPFHVQKIVDHGPPEHNVDLLIMGDGYTETDMSHFQNSVDRYTKKLFAQEPFKTHFTDFNVWRIDVVSPDSGVDEPRQNLWKRTVFDVQYNTFDVPRYVLAQNNKMIHDVAAMVPYDHIYILFNSDRYGGGGIFHATATCYTGSQAGQPDWWADYVFIHEFGHSFAGLADEYYTSAVAYTDLYPGDVEPWEPNITALLKPEQLKWAPLVNKDTPIPTPWNKAQFDSLTSAQRGKTGSAKEELKKSARKTMENDLYANRVGCFEGAGYSAKGLYRPTIDCIMFSKSLRSFCPVCQQAIKRKILFEIQ